MLRLIHHDGGRLNQTRLKAVDDAMVHAFSEAEIIGVEYQFHDDLLLKDLDLIS